MKRSHSLADRRLVNRKAVVILALACAGLGATTHFVHGFQVKRNSRALFEQALQAEREGDPALTADYLQQYLGLEPNDVDARARLGLLLFGRAKSRPEQLRAFLVLDDVLRRDPQRQDVRRAATELAVRFGRF